MIFDSHEYYYEQIKTKEYIPAIFRNIIAALYKQYETYVCKELMGLFLFVLYEEKMVLSITHFKADVSYINI